MLQDFGSHFCVNEDVHGDHHKSEKGLILHCVGAKHSARTRE